MFTGIVQCIGRIVSLTPNAAATRLVVQPETGLDAETRPPRAGDSICVSGVCLTVTDTASNQLSFDVIAETLRCTKLGDLQQGDAVNLEPAVAPNQPLGGHFMQGHIDAMGTVTRSEQSEGEWRLGVSVDSQVAQYLAAKGSIAIDGVSLTVAKMLAEGFEVALIPTTMDLTTLGRLQVGDRVNLETDILARTVVDWLSRQFVQTQGEGEAASNREAVSRALLEQAGFDAMP
jgi:riboflavin synthase